MSTHAATVVWYFSGPEDSFLTNTYSRVHEWHFDGGSIVEASASPNIVNPPYSSPAAVDPEEAYVASLASCHMLFFLALAAKENLVVTEYRDAAVGEMHQDSEGKTAITRVTLNPSVSFSDSSQPDLQTIEALHHDAHEHCFIANSVKTEIVINTSLSDAGHSDSNTGSKTAGT